MGEVFSNFDFLEKHSPQLTRLGLLAERYFANDPPAALVKLRQFAEFMAKDVAARHALLSSAPGNLDNILRTLRARSVLPREIADLFFHLKQTGNIAAHEDRGNAADALTSLKIARQIGSWYHRTYHDAAAFKPGPFIPPPPPVDATVGLRAELETLRKAVAASADAQAKAQLAAQQADAERARLAEQAGQEAKERAFWEDYAAQTEAALRSAEKTLATTQAEALSTPPQQLDLLARMGAESAAQVELDEPTTRIMIDEQLRNAGWIVDSVVLRHAAGARPEYGQSIAIAEWPTKSGPVDYALFVDGRCVAVIEAKRQVRDVPGRIGQAKRYARDITLSPDELPSGGPWVDGNDRFRVPLLFATNGRPYVKQLATKSGIWFWDARTKAAPRALSEWFSPRDLVEKLEQQIGDDPNIVADRELGVTGLRPYQKEAIQAVEEAVSRGSGSHPARHGDRHRQDPACDCADVRIAADATLSTDPVPRRSQRAWSPDPRCHEHDRYQWFL
jgi:type I restriction enzyme R subunit